MSPAAGQRKEEDPLPLTPQCGWVKEVKEPPVSAYCPLVSAWVPSSSHQMGGPGEQDLPGVAVVG